jgi:hypothetical protein
LPLHCVEVLLVVQVAPSERVLQERIEQRNNAKKCTLVTFLAFVWLTSSFNSRFIITDI